MTNENIGAIQQNELNNMILSHESWLKNGAGKRIDVTGLDFGGLKFTGSLSKARFDNCLMEFCNFVDAELTGTDFITCNLNESHFESSSSNKTTRFSNCTLHNTVLKGSALHVFVEHSSFHSADFLDFKFKPGSVFKQETKFTETSWKETVCDSVEFLDRDFTKAVFEDHSFTKASLRGCLFLRSDWTGVTSVFALKIRDSDLPHCIMPDKDFSKANNPNCIIEGCDFNGANIKDCKFNGQDLRTCEFTAVKFQETNFSDCDLRRVNFAGAKGFKPEFFMSELYQANFSNTYLKGSNFLNAKASRAVFIAADISSSDMRFADFTLADFSQATTTQTRFGGTWLAGAKWHDGTTCEVGSQGICIPREH